MKSLTLFERKPMLQKRIFSLVLLFSSSLLLSSCSGLISSTFIEPTVGNLQKQTDIQLVCEGAPTFLLMADSMIASDPENTAMLTMGAQSYAGYLGALAECDPETDRLPAIADKAHKYGTALLANYLPLKADGDIDKQLAKLSKRDVPALFWGCFAWISWIQVQEGSPTALADLVVIEKIMQRVLELDPEFQGGGAHLFMGGYLASKPPMLGGKPELAREHFEQSLAISERKSLLTHVTYAEKYARMTLNEELHNQLLQEVIDFPLDKAPEYTLSNQLAKRKAARLLEEDYFLE